MRKFDGWKIGQRLEKAQFLDFKSIIDWNVALILMDPQNPSTIEVLLQFHDVMSVAEDTSMPLKAPRLQ